MIFLGRGLFNHLIPAPAASEGRFERQSVTSNDYALMQGIFLIITVTVLVVNFIIDLLYGIIDPPLRLY